MVRIDILDGFFKRFVCLSSLDLFCTIWVLAVPALAVPAITSADAGSMPKFAASVTSSVRVDFVDLKRSFGVLNFNFKVFTGDLSGGVGGCDDGNFDAVGEDVPAGFEFMKRGVLVKQSSKYSLSHKMPKRDTPNPHQ